MNIGKSVEVQLTKSLTEDVVILLKTSMRYQLNISMWDLVCDATWRSLNNTIWVSVIDNIEDEYENR
jgi:hypothetical protein